MTSTVHDVPHAASSSRDMGSLTAWAAACAPARRTSAGTSEGAAPNVTAIVPGTTKGPSESVAGRVRHSVQKGSCCTACCHSRQTRSQRTRLCAGSVARTRSTASCGSSEKSESCPATASAAIAGATAGDA